MWEWLDSASAVFVAGQVSGGFASFLFCGSPQVDEWAHALIGSEVGRLILQNVQNSSKEKLLVGSICSGWGVAEMCIQSLNKVLSQEMHSKVEAGWFSRKFIGSMPWGLFCSMYFGWALPRSRRPGCANMFHGRWQSSRRHSLEHPFSTTCWSCTVVLPWTPCLARSWMFARSRGAYVVTPAKVFPRKTTMQRAFLTALAPPGQGSIA